VIQCAHTVAARQIAHYRVVEPLGRGGMGEVYRALDTRLDRMVALKLLRPETRDAGCAKRFVREAKAASALNHPNIVTVYEIGVAGGIDYIALEYIDGTPLNQLIAGRPLDPSRALDYALQIADALSAAHAAGIVHRDLKPANIMVARLSGRDVVKVLDFGLAKRTDSAPSDGATYSAVTGPGAVVGTPAYMAPEQAQGRAVDARADVFAFGAVVYEMLAGRLPFSGDSDVSTLMAVVSHPPAPLRGLPADLTRLVMRCLEKDPAARYGSGKELRAALGECESRLAGANQVYDFGPYRLDAALSRLSRGSEPITIPPKAFDLLLLLARNQHRVIPKTEVMEALWPNTFVEEGNLTQHIYTLRKALGDRPEGGPYIETVPRRGYRLAASVREDAAVAAMTPTDVEPIVRESPRPTPSAGGSADQPRAAIVLEGERKRATALHCSLADASGLAERFGSIELHALVEKVQAVAHEEVERYEGVVTQTLADGFVAIFGAREVHEDDARRAVLAAIAIVRRAGDSMPPTSPDEERIALKTGITTGSLVINQVTDRDRSTYVAVGDPLRTADLLQQFAEPGVILMDEATHRAVRNHIASDPGGLIGRSVTFRVTGICPPSRPASEAGRTLATFIGREREAFLLDGLFAQARAGKGQAVSVVGEPGMGKSRLIYECTRAMSHATTVAVLEGRCVSYGTPVPYLPLVDLLRVHCQIGETESTETIHEAVERMVDDNGLPRDAAAWLLRLFGIIDEPATHEPLSPEAIKARTFDALRLLLLKGAARRPLVIVIEDLHWIDRTSEEFLSTLVGQLTAARILLIASYRPGYRPPWMDRSYVTQVTLAPLSSDESARLLESVAGTERIDVGTSSVILQRGEGNPFFLEELARTVLEQGASAPAIPDTVQGVIMARLDRLPDVPKRLLQTGSVIGREVPLRLLARVWEDTNPFDADLVELCRQEFLYERPAADEAVYVFKHALTQDVAYDSLLTRRRRDLHLATARALEDLHAGRLDDIAATLAYHYARTDVIDEAVTWLMRAADQAARVYANAEAVLHLDLAARRLQRLPEGLDRDRRMLEVALAHAHSLYFLGRFRESVDVLLPHAARVARLGDPARAAQYSFWLAHMYSRLGDQRRAAESAHAAIESATRAGDRATLGKAHGLLALEGHWSGNTADGLAHGRTAIELLAPLVDQRWWLGMAHFYLAMNHMLTGEHDIALAEAARADAVGKMIGDPRLQTYAGFITGWIEIARGRSNAALDLLRRSVEMAPDRVSRAYASMILGFALLETGQHAEAIARLDPIVKELESFAFPQWHGLATILIGEAQRRAGCLDEAARSTASGREIAARANYRYAIEFGDRIAGLIAQDRSRRPQSA
jgi:serine/threonine protein kinase/class 3 adenylate cyclase/tetratricopeptide (TPR) repeat protein